MAVTIRATNNGDSEWQAALEVVEVVAASAAECFPVFADESIAITPLNSNDSPMTVQDPSLPEGEAVVRLSTDGMLWSQLAFQFAHEFCHVIADPKTMPWDRFLWLEEAICETASLFALRCMGTTWSVAPPYPNWRNYAENLEKYASERMCDADHCLPQGVRFGAWLSEHLSLLEKDAGRRDDNTIIAKQLLPIFERDAAGWLAVRNLHDGPRSTEAILPDFFAGWARACSALERPAYLDARSDRTRTVRHPATGTPSK